MIYYLIFSVLVIAAFINVFHPSNKTGIVGIRCGSKLLLSYRKNGMFLILSMLLILFAAFRWNVGLDFGTYQNAFETIKNGGDASLSDLSYIIISKIMPTLTMVFSVYALLSVSYIARFIKNESPYTYLSLMLFYGLFFLRFDMGIMRQGLAMAITLYSIRYAREKQLIKFLLLVALASFVHGSAICFVIVYFFVDREFNIYTYLVSLIICAVIGFTNLWKYLMVVVSYLPIPMISKYMAHLANESYLNFGFDFTDLKNLVLFILFDINASKISKIDDRKKYNTLINIYFIGVCIYFAFRPFITVSDRAVAYFTMTEILLIPIVIRYTRSNVLKFFMTILACAYSFRTVYIYCNYITTSWMNANYVPYTTFFTK